MNGAAAQETGVDWIDVLLNTGIVATFVVFAIALWLIKRESRKKNPPPQDQSSS